MKRRNGIRRLQEMMVGGRPAVQALSPERRLYYRELARKLYDAGTTTGRAEEYQKYNRNGFVYLITHPAFPGYVKIGRACNPESRLNAFQTGCPFRGYQLEEAVYFHDCYFAEGELHARQELKRKEGEWFRSSVDEAKRQLYLLRETI